MAIFYNYNYERCKSSRHLHQSRSAGIRQFLYNSELHFLLALIISELSQAGIFVSFLRKLEGLFSSM